MQSLAYFMHILFKKTRFAMSSARFSEYVMQTNQLFLICHFYLPLGSFMAGLSQKEAGAGWGIVKLTHNSEFTHAILTKMWHV